MNTVYERIHTLCLRCNAGRPAADYARAMRCNALLAVRSLILIREGPYPEHFRGHLAVQARHNIITRWTHRFDRLDTRAALLAAGFTE